MPHGVGGPLFPGLRLKPEEGALMLFTGGAWVTSLTFPATSLSGIVPPANGGTGINNGSFTLTVPATGTAALLGVANNFSAVNQFSNATDSSSVSTGSLYAAGGIGAAKSLFIGGNYVSTGSDITGGNDNYLRFTRTGYTTGATGMYFRNSGNTDSGAFGNQGSSTHPTILWATADTTFVYAPTRARIATGTNANNYFEVTGTAVSLGSGTTLTVNNVTDSTTKDSGSIVTEGGIGVEKAIYSGSEMNSGGNVTAGVRSASSGGGGNFRCRDDTGTLRWLSGLLGSAAAVDYVLYDVVGGATRLTLTPAGLLSLSNTTDSTTKDTGSIVTEGGIGVEKAVNVGTTLSVLGTTTSTTLTSNALYTAGGIGIADAKNINVGSTTGCIIGTATTQKLGFWNVTPVIQPANANQAAVATTAATNITPYGFTTAAQADGIITLLNGIRSALVSAGIIKGAA